MIDDETRIAPSPVTARRDGPERRIRAVILALMLACLASSAPESFGEEPPKARTLPKTWHATVFFSSGESYRIIHYWSSGSMMRAETLIGGHPITTIIRGDRYIAFDRLTGRALDVERSPAAVTQDQGRVRPFAIELEDLKRAGGEKIEETTMSGVPVEVWRLTDDNGRRTVWVSKKEPFVPIRAETFVRGSSQTLIFDYSNWGFDLEIPASFFALPSDVEVVRFGYAEFEKRSAKEPVGVAPILYPDLLHGGTP
jgi:outer membrane lipoprotein-sorting protein